MCRARARILLTDFAICWEKNRNLHIDDDVVKFKFLETHYFQRYWYIFNFSDSACTMFHSLGVVTSLDWLLTSPMFGAPWLDVK